MIDWSQYTKEVTPENVPEDVRDLCKQFGLHPYMGVLCGWEWAIAHKNVVPDYKVELQFGSSKQTLNTSKADVLNKVMRIYRR